MGIALLNKPMQVEAVVETGSSMRLRSAATRAFAMTSGDPKSKGNISLYLNVLHYYFSVNY
jgi:hypothetical protein